MKPAVLYAETIAVCCPHCEAEQPAPDNGSDMWLPSQIAERTLTCVSCEERFPLRRARTVRMPYDAEHEERTGS